MTQTPRERASDDGSGTTNRLQRTSTRRQLLRFGAAAGATALAGCGEPLEYTRSVEVYNEGRTTHEFAVDVSIDEEQVFGETLSVAPGERRTFEGALDDALSERESGLFRLRTVIDDQSQVAAEVDIETEFRPTGVSTGLDTLSEPQLVAKISEPFEFGGAADRYAYQTVGPGVEPHRLAQLRPATPADGDRFGDAVALDGDRALVGAGTAASSPTVFVNAADGWRRDATLRVSGDAPTDAVALDTDTAMVARQNAVAVFERAGETWQQQSRLGPFADPTALAIDGSRALVGDPGAARQDDGLSGTVSVLERTDNGWERTAVLKGATAGVERFGSVVALADDTVAATGFPVGAAAGDAEEAAGTVHVFELTGSGWRRQTTVDGGPADRFGAALAISADTLVVGAPFADADEGAAYVFARTDGDWERQTGFTPNDRYTDDRFGGSVGVWQDVAFAAGRYSIVGIGRYEGRWTHRAAVEDEAASTGGTVLTPVDVDTGSLLVGVPAPRLETTPGGTATETPSETTPSPAPTTGAPSTATQQRTDTSTPTGSQSTDTATPTPESEQIPPGRAHVFTLGDELEDASTSTETTRQRNADTT